MLHLTQSHIDVLSSITPIINGKVDLFVKSVFKRKRWFDTYICIWYGYEYEETKQEPEENHYAKKVIYELVI